MPFPAFLAVLLAATLTVSGLSWHRVVVDAEEADRIGRLALAEGTACLGADAALRDDCVPPFGDLVTPHPAVSRDRFQRSRWHRCLTGLGTTRFTVCRFGSATAGVHVVLFGDSHALQWLPALNAIAEARHWRITTLLRASCPPSPARLQLPDRTGTELCHRWSTRAVARILSDDSVDLVVTTGMNNKRWRKEGGLDRYRTGVTAYRRTWERLLAGGRRTVLVIRDTPVPLPDVQSCVARADSPAECRRARRAATSQPVWRGRQDPLVAAVEEAANPRIRLADLTDAFCGADACDPVIGNVLVYADKNHVTETYARTLVPLLTDHLRAALRPASAVPETAARPGSGSSAFRRSSGAAAAGAPALRGRPASHRRRGPPR
ncbi:MAG: hypothetical protein GXX79_00630 [Actinomycetales bacterium]|nr:hypothetical protein [Actinomycetales bacterium]